MPDFESILCNLFLNFSYYGYRLYHHLCTDLANLSALLMCKRPGEPKISLLSWKTEIQEIFPASHAIIQFKML